MSEALLEVGDEVVHQSHPGRFVITAIEARPSMNVYSRILSIRSASGVEMRVLDTTVRYLPAIEPVTADSEPSPEETVEG